MAKQDQPRASKTKQSSGSSEQRAQEQPNKFVLPQQAAAVDQWADLFHIQIGPLGVRLWFGTSRGDSSTQADIRTAVFLPGQVGQLFLAHARAMAEAKKIELTKTASPTTVAH